MIPVFSFKIVMCSSTIINKWFNVSIVNIIMIMLGNVVVSVSGTSLDGKVDNKFWCLCIIIFLCTLCWYSLVLRGYTYPGDERSYRPVSYMAKIEIDAKKSQNSNMYHSLFLCLNYYKICKKTECFCYSFEILLDVRLYLKPLHSPEKRTKPV